jgi:N-acetylmuramoyl-L-alanine amidase
MPTTSSLQPTLQQRSLHPIATRRRRRSSGGIARPLGWTGAFIVAAVLATGLALAVEARFNPSHALDVPAIHVGGKPVTIAQPPPGSYAVKVNPVGLPLGLAPATCVEFNPTGKDRNQAVFVDPGHGGPDPGAVGGGLQEKDVSLAVGIRLKDLLRADGFHVVMSRTTDTSVAKLRPDQVVNGAITASGVHVDTIARIDCANSSGALALVAIHFNAYSDPSASGQEVFYDDVRDFAAQNQRLAGLLHDRVAAAFAKAGWQVYDRGIISDADTGNTGLTAQADAYGRLMEIGPQQAGWNDHPSLMPGAMVEPLFLTAPAEAQVASSSEGRGAIASGLEQALLQFLQPPASPAP